MNYIDYILLFFILIGFILGYKDGFIRKLIGLFGLVAAIILAITYSSQLGEKFSPMFNDEVYIAKLFSGIIIFSVTILIVAVLKRLIHPADKVNNFLNQILGGLTGTLQIVFFLSLFLLLLNIFNLPDEDDRERSYLYSGVYSILPALIDKVVGSNFKTEGFIKDYIDTKSNTEIPEDFIPPIDSLIQDD